MHILGEELLSQHGALKRVRRYLAGHHPHLGRLTMGWQGPETVIEQEVITPVSVITVHDRADAPPPRTPSRLHRHS
jgi:hypothetical protein